MRPQPTLMYTAALRNLSATKIGLQHEVGASISIRCPQLTLSLDIKLSTRDGTIDHRHSENLNDNHVPCMVMYYFNRLSGI